MFYKAYPLRLSRNLDMTGLDVSNNSVLGYLDCPFTGINRLNVHNNSELYYLDCSYTDIDTLDCP